jgi:hypothetical protein
MIQNSSFTCLPNFPAKVGTDVFHFSSLPNRFHIPVKLVFVGFARFGVMCNSFAFNNPGEFCVGSVVNGKFRRLPAFQVQ